MIKKQIALVLLTGLSTQTIVSKNLAFKSKRQETQAYKNYQAARANFNNSKVGKKLRTINTNLKNLNYKNKQWHVLQKEKNQYRLAAQNYNKAEERFDSIIRKIKTGNKTTQEKKQIFAKIPEYNTLKIQYSEYQTALANYNKAEETFLKTKAGKKYANLQRQKQILRNSLAWKKLNNAWQTLQKVNRINKK